VEKLRINPAVRASKELEKNKMKRIRGKQRGKRKM